MDVRIVSKNVKGGVYARIEDRVGWGVDIGLDADYFIVVDVVINMSKVDSNLWVIFWILFDITWKCRLSC